jgi:hypothetical protein
LLLDRVDGPNKEIVALCSSASRTPRAFEEVVEVYEMLWRE